MSHSLGSSKRSHHSTESPNAARTNTQQSPRSAAAAAASASPASSSSAAVDPKRRRVESSPRRSNTSNSSGMQRTVAAGAPGSSAQMPMQIEDDSNEEMKSASSSSSAAAAAAPAPAPAPRARARSPPPKKKVAIKPFKVAPRPPDAYASESLSNLSAAVSAVYAQSHSAFSQEELYRAVEALCNLHKGPEIYTRLYKQCDEHIGEQVQSLAKQVAREDEEHTAMAITSPTAATASPAASTAAESSPISSSTTLASASSSHLSLPLLQSLQSVWSAHCQEMIIIRGIFLFLDRTYVMKQAEMAGNNGSNGNGGGNGGSASLNNNATPTRSPPASLWEMGLTLFCDHLLRHPRVASKTIGGLLCLVEKERLGESINRPLLKSLLRMLSALKLYAPEFQPLFLEASAKFYRAESRKSIASEGEASVVDYIHSISSRFAQEEERCIAYLDEATRGPLMGVLEQELIAAHASHLLGPAFSALIDSKRIAELSAVYKLFARIHSLELMRAAFEAYVKRTSESIVKSGSVSSEEAAKPAASADAAPSSSSAAAPPAAGPSTPATMVIDLLRLKLTLDEILSYSFNSDVDFIKSLKLAFEAALNCVDNVPAELIAKFMDRVLRTGGKGIKITPYATTTNAGQAQDSAGGMDDVANAAGSVSASALPAAASASASAAASAVVGDDVETLLDQLMFLFRYLHSKDIFQAWYKKDLAKRLLLAKSASVDSEKSMISKIKNECGASFTTKLEGMFKDMELSKDIQKEYEAQCKVQKGAGGAGATSMDVDAEHAGAAAASSSSSSADGGGMELSVQVLTTGSWPAYTALECTLPPEVARMHEDFKLFYLNKHSGRKLVWHHSLATATLRAHFPRGRKELAVSAIQAVVLMQFNDHVRLSLEEIGRYAGITDAMELKRTLASLTFTDDLRLLLKEPRNKKLLPTDIFSVNTDFAYKLFRIKINSVQLKETKEEHKATSARVLEDRQYALDACIVRVMKSRKSLHHQQLVGEVLAQSKFPAKPADIKRRIASLIEREYMARDENDSNMYNYMA